MKKSTFIRKIQKEIKLLEKQVEGYAQPSKARTRDNWIIFYLKGILNDAKKLE